MTTTDAMLSNDADPYDENGYNVWGFNAEGYDRDGYNAEGYDEYGYNAEGYNAEGYDENGFDADFYDENGFDADGYDENGFDADGYDTYGFNADGYDVNGEDRNGDRYCGDCECCPCECDQSSQCCSVPQTTFKIRNDGNEPLANDTRTNISLPAGTISEEGIKAISRYLRECGERNLSFGLDAIGPEWQTRAGNYTKRLSRHAYKAYGAKLTPETLSNIGNIARDHSTAVNVDIDVTRLLDESAGYFYHEGSCWWTSYYESRCTLKTNGGFGIRSFRPDCGYASGYSLSGRAWVMPLRQTWDVGLTPTFETLTPDAFVVFNGYGDLSGYAAARILAHMAGWTYRKIDFDCEPMYINAGGYLVTREDIATKYTDGSLYLSVNQHSNLYQSELANA